MSRRASAGEMIPISANAVPPRESRASAAEAYFIKPGRVGVTKIALVSGTVLRSSDYQVQLVKAASHCRLSLRERLSLGNTRCSARRPFAERKATLVRSDRASLGNRIHAVPDAARGFPVSPDTPGRRSHTV